MNKMYRVKVFVKGTIEAVVGARSEEHAKQIAEDSVALRLPPEFGGVISAGRPKLGRARRRAQR